MAGSAGSESQRQPATDQQSPAAMIDQNQRLDVI